MSELVVKKHVFGRFVLLPLESRRMVLPASSGSATAVNHQGGHRVREFLRLTLAGELHNPSVPL